MYTFSPWKVTQNLFDGAVVKSVLPVFKTRFIENVFVFLWAMALFCSTPINEGPGLRYCFYILLIAWIPTSCSRVSQKNNMKFYLTFILFWDSFSYILGCFGQVLWWKQVASITWASFFNGGITSNKCLWHHRVLGLKIQLGTIFTWV